MTTNIQTNDIWITKKIYDDAENAHYEGLAKAALTPLAGEVAKARQRLIESRDTFTISLGTCSKNQTSSESQCRTKRDVKLQPHTVRFAREPMTVQTGLNENLESVDTGAIKFIEKKVVEFEKSICAILKNLKELDGRMTAIEGNLNQFKIKPMHEINVAAPPNQKVIDTGDDDDDVDLFGSESDEDETAAKVREERLAAYAAKKSKKPALIAKSNVILDIKPWDDETDMKLVEEKVREIEMEGLLWGAAKLVPLAYGVLKLQISSVVEDDKVSIEELTERIEAIEDLVQSVDIAAFNKI